MSTTTPWTCPFCYQACENESQKAERREFIRTAAIEFAVKCFDVKDGSTLPPRCWEAAEHLWRCKPEDC